MRSSDAITISMPEKIEEAVTEYAPELKEGGNNYLPKGEKLTKMADALKMPERQIGAKLDKRQVLVQRILGSLKFIEKVQPRLSLILHRLSCIMAYPPPEALIVAKAALATAYKHKEDGITFGGTIAEDALTGSLYADGPELESERIDQRVDTVTKANVDLNGSAGHRLEAHADATWGDRNILALVLTFAGGAILHQTKKLALICDSSMETEAIASSKGGEAIAYAREIMRAFGEDISEPTTLTTDNLSHQRIGSGFGAPTRSKPFLRRYYALKQRIEGGEVSLKHCPDASMPADFLTKWLGMPKVNKSIRYCTNARNAVRPESATNGAHS